MSLLPLFLPVYHFFLYSGDLFSDSLKNISAIEFIIAYETDKYI